MDQDLEFIHAEIDSLSWHLNRRHGVLDRLVSEARRGRWLHPETTEAMRLISDANALRKMADEMLRIRNELVGNMPNLSEAAE